MKASYQDNVCSYHKTYQLSAWPLTKLKEQPDFAATLIMFPTTLLQQTRPWLQCSGQPQGRRPGMASTRWELPHVVCNAAAPEAKTALKKVSMVQLGCPKNTVDGESLNWGIVHVCGTCESGICRPWWLRKPLCRGPGPTGRWSAGCAIMSIHNCMPTTALGLREKACTLRCVLVCQLTNWRELVVPTVLRPPATVSTPFAWYAGEVLLGDLYRAGFEVTDDHEDADAIVVNTCAFVEDAKTESIEVRRWCN